MSKGQRSSTPGVHREIWSAATSYIDAHLHAPLTLERVARAAFTSRRQLQRVFADEGAKTVRSYIVGARMRRASELVISSDHALAAIAAEVGYGHVASFVKAFRLYYGVTPMEHRRRYQRAHV
jgi:AraC-like DNA-binding protein